MVRKILFTLFASLILTTTQAKETNRTGRVYVIPIKNMIEPALLYVVRRGVDEAARHKVDAIVIDMDTPGGGVSAAIEIIDELTKADIPLYTFVGREAISAGAFISLATPNIYMAPGTLIGDITPIMMGMTGGVQDLPEAEKEKMTSYVAARVRSVAEHGGYDPRMAEAMVRRDIEYKVGDKVISESGEVMTLTASEATQMVDDGSGPRPLFAKGIVKDIDEMLVEVGLGGAEQIVLEATAAESLARIIAKFAPFLMMLGLGGIWLEIKTPGFGIFGIAGITCLVLFFFGHHIAGLSGMEDFLLFAMGIVLLAIEVFITPGFGVMGFSGLLLIFVSFISAMSERMPGTWRPIDFSPETFSVPFLKVMLSFLGAFALVLVVGKFLPKTKAFRSLTLGEVVPDAVEDQSLLGRSGVAHSDLRPGGTAYFNGRKIDVVTHGDYIPSQASIRIVEVHGNRFVVEKV